MLCNEPICIISLLDDILCLWEFVSLDLINIYAGGMDDLKSWTLILNHGHYYFQ